MAVTNSFWDGSSGDYAWTTAGNWTTAQPDTSGDTATFDGRAASKVDGSDQTATTLAALRVYQGCIYDIGSSTTPLQIKATKVEIGLPNPDGSSGAGASVISLDLSTATTTIDVYNSRSSGTGGLPPVLIKASSSSGTTRTLHVHGGSVGFAVGIPEQTGTLEEANIDGGRLVIGSGTTLTTLNQGGGEATLNCAVTTLTQDGGQLTARGSGAGTTLNVGGQVTWQSSGTVTTLKVLDGGVFRAGRTPFTVSNATVYGSGRIEDPYSVVTWTNGVDCIGGAHSSQVDLGENITVTPSAV